MHFRKSLLLLILSLSGCGPDAPKVTVCVMRNTDIKCQKPNGDQFVIAYTQAKGFLMLSPEDASKEKDYVLKLERIAAKCN